MGKLCSAKSIDAPALLQSLEGRCLLDAALPFESYFPEGYAGVQVDASVPILNSGDTAAQFELWARYERSDAQCLLASGTVPAHGSVEEVISQAGGVSTPGLRRDEPFAYVLKASQPLTAALHHDDFGNQLVEQFTTRAASRWTFAQSRRGDDAIDFILVYNPGNTAVDATLTLYSENGAVISSTIQLQPMRRGGWSIKDLAGLNVGDYSAEVVATGNIVACQSQYRLQTPRPHGFSQLGTPGTGAVSGFLPALELDSDFYTRRLNNLGTDVPGITTPDLKVSVFNSDADNAANVTLTFVFSDSSITPLTRTVDVSAGKRASFSMANLNIPAGAQFGVLYSADLPVTVAASVYQGNSLVGVQAATRAATTWTFGRGSTDVPAFGRGLREDLFVFNPSGAETTVSIDLIRPNGSIVTLTKHIGSHNLEDINFANEPTLTSPQDRRPFIVVVRSDVPLVASYQRRDPFKGVDFSILGTPSGTVLDFADAFQTDAGGGTLITPY